MLYSDSIYFVTFYWLESKLYNFIGTLLILNKLLIRLSFLLYLNRIIPEPALVNPNIIQKYIWYLYLQLNFTKTFNDEVSQDWLESIQRIYLGAKLMLHILFQRSTYMGPKSCFSEEFLFIIHSFTQIWNTLCFFFFKFPSMLCLRNIIPDKLVKI
jgi:hypothetical protein